MSIYHLLSPRFDNNRQPQNVIHKTNVYDMTQGRPPQGAIVHTHYHTVPSQHIGGVVLGSAQRIGVPVQYLGGIILGGSSQYVGVVPSQSHFVIHK